MPTMPNVVGMEYPAALQALTVAGVRVVPLGYFQTDPVTITWVKSATNPGIVITQTPASGLTAAANSAVQLTVSNYPMSVAGGTTQVDV